MMNLAGLTIRDIEKKFRGEEDLSDQEIAILESDHRAGAKQIAGRLKKRAERREAESLRIREMLRRESILWEEGLSYVAGVDEVGVGPFAGPVVAAAVVFPRGVSIEGVKDSKMLDHRRRVALDAEIRHAALSVGLGVVDVEEIDRINIYRASLKAMRLSVMNLGMRIQHVLVDGRNIPDLGIPQEAIAGGDADVFSIAAASIVAKVYRDNLMITYGEKFPQYGFARHKGYGTAEHLRVLREHGPCEIHRRSFDWRRASCPVQPSGWNRAEGGDECRTAISSTQPTLQ